MTLNDKNDNMTSLVNLLKKRGIPYTIKQHPAAKAEPQVKKLIGYYPTGKRQIIINETFSVIRGAVSFGLFEIMNIKGGDQFNEPERFTSAKELLDAL